MKKHIKHFLIFSLIILSLTGCEDGIDIILTETSWTEASKPSIIESVPEENLENTTVITNNEVLPPITTIIISRPSIEQELEHHAERGQDISFEPIEETEESVIAKKYISEMQEAVDCIGDTSWSSVIDIDEYINDGYLKDYILFGLKIRGRSRKRFKDNYEIGCLEAIEQKQVGDIIYVKVKLLAQYIDSKNNDWSSVLTTEWVGIRNGRIVDESIIAGENVYGYIGIEEDMKNIYGEPIGYSFPPQRNPWDNIEDIKKIYNGLKSQGFGIEMKEYPQPN